MAGITPTQRTLKFLKDRDYTSGIVERFIAIPGSFGKRIDLFNLIDIISIKNNQIMGVQSCGQAFADHHNKMIENAHIKKWLAANGRLILIGWRKLKKKRGGKAMIWTPRIREYDLLKNEKEHKLIWEDIEQEGF